MKLVDRYLVREFLFPFACCFCAFSIMYVIFDLFGNMSEFLDSRIGLSRTLCYYALYLLAINGNAPFVVLILPVCLLLAALYTLATLTRHNELIAMRTSGMSLVRLVLPFLAMGLAGALAASIVQETITPRASRWTKQFEKQNLKGRNRSAVIAGFPYYNSAAHRRWIIDKFDPEHPGILRGVKVVEEDSGGRRKRELTARGARWLDGHWWFGSLRIQNYGSDGEPSGPPVAMGSTPFEMAELDENPLDFVNELSDWEFLSSGERVAFLRTHPGLSNGNKAAKLVDFHNRLALPWSCLVVVLLGIPSGARTGRQGALLGVMLAILFFFCFYAVMHFGLFLGKRQLLWPWFAAWLPNITFFLLGSFMISRMR